MGMILSDEAAKILRYANCQLVHQRVINKNLKMQLLGYNIFVK